MISIILTLLLVGLLLASIKEDATDGTVACSIGLGIIFLINVFNPLLSDDQYYSNRKYSDYIISETVVEINYETYRDKIKDLKNGNRYVFDREMKNLWKVDKYGVYGQSGGKVFEEHLIPDETGVEPIWYLVNYKTHIGLISIVGRKSWIFVKRYGGNV